MKKFLAWILVISMGLVFMATAQADFREGEWYIATADVNVRAEPSLYADVLGKLTEGQEVYVEGHFYTRDGYDWCKLEYYGTMGYVSSEYLTLETEEELEQGLEIAKEFITTGDVNVRLWPDLDSDVLDVIKEGVSVWGSYLVTSEDGRTWLQITGKNGNYGFVSTRYLRLAESSTIVFNRYSKTVRRTVAYDDFGKNAKALGYVQVGLELEVLNYLCGSDGIIWAYCMKDGVRAYVKAEDLIAARPLPYDVEDDFFW